MPRSTGSSDGRAREAVAEQLRVQARACAAMGSPLYADLLTRAADDALDAGPVWQVVRTHFGPGRGGALALRLMAAAHRLVLTGRAPDLARHYPSVGGAAALPAASRAFRSLLADCPEEVSELVGLPCQTNEVGRCAPLLGGFLDIAVRTGLPLRLLEVGASAGLNLRWDRFRYGGGGGEWGDPASPVDLTGLWEAAPPNLAARVRIAERRGCDPAPIDSTTAEGQLTLTASVWADQVERLERLRGAFRLAAEVPARVDRASVADWLPDRLAEVRPGAATVVFHSVVEEYLDVQSAAALRAALAEAGEAAAPDAPLAWLRLEPSTMLRHHVLTLTTWPGGSERTLATSGAHGAAVCWLRGDEAPPVPLQR